MTVSERDEAAAAAPTTRDLLYDAAADLFVEQGYEDTTMADIAARAGTARRTAFNHFPNKGDIPMLWARRMADRAVEAFAAHSDDRAPEQIYAYFQHISRLVEMNPELSRQMLLGWVAAGGPIRYESQFLADLTPVLEAGQLRGEIDASVDIATAARALSDMYTGVVFRWVREQWSPPCLQTVTDEAIGLLCSGIRARA
ncbi:TetR/AcrR family transcriptional regulator [Mycobacterium sp. WMMD1722]|uniref:TetR/AcrR family transcriptional regulator n=1 Tax=Mycobacterium sp. WMMD1722 TaxID=3404117 RepID=UPI003BF52125